MIKKYQLMKLLEEKKLLKVISGMENFNEENIKMVVNAANTGSAQSVDISADSDNIKWVKENYTGLIVFVSSLSTAMLIKAREYGADVLELGNYDAVYTQGKKVSKEEVVELTRELRSKTNAPICITIPGNIEIEEQVDLAVQIQAAGADIIQVENLKRESEYENAKAIVKAVQIPVLLSGRIDSTNIEKALSTGVNAIGIGTAINSKPDISSMVDEVKASMKAFKISKVSV